MTRGDIFIVPPKIEHQVVRLEDVEIICCEFSFDHFFPPKENSAYQQVHEATLNLSFAWLFLKDADDMHSQFSLRPETSERVNTLMNAMLLEYENGDMYYEEFLRVQIMELLLVLAREYSQSPQRHTAATASGAAIAWLSGATPAQISQTITNTIANVSGIVCDGAKASCAAKIASSVSAAITGYYMAMDGNVFQPGEGLVGSALDDTVESYTTMGREGMATTDVTILKMMLDEPNSSPVNA